MSVFDVATGGEPPDHWTPLVIGEIFLSGNISEATFAFSFETALQV